jgi:TolB-like protein
MSGPTLAIDATARAITLDGTPVTLGARAFDVLAHLDANRDRVVSKAELLETVWGGLSVEEGNLTVQISALRKVLGAKAIATVPGVGYKLTFGLEPEKDHEGPPLPDKPSLVVLPFANLSGTPENDYLVDGLITDIIASLSRLSALYVIAASTSFRFKGQPVDVADVGRQLGVRYAVEGSVQQAGPMLRVTVQLVEAATGRTIWSERFTGTTENVFDLQDEIAARVAGAVEPKLMFAEAGLSQAKPTEDLGAYDLVLRALPHVYGGADAGGLPQGRRTPRSGHRTGPGLQDGEGVEGARLPGRAGRADDLVGGKPRSRAAGTGAAGRGGRRPAGAGLLGTVPRLFRLGPGRRGRGRAPRAAALPELGAGEPRGGLAAQLYRRLRRGDRGVRDVASGSIRWATWRSIAGWGRALSHVCAGGSIRRRDHGAGLCRTPVLRDPREFLVLGYWAPGRWRRRAGWRMSCAGSSPDVTLTSALDSTPTGSPNSGN